MKNLVKLLFILALISGLNGCNPSLETAGLVNGDTSNYQSSSSSSAGNLWDSISNGFVLDHNSDKREVQVQIRWFMNHQDYLQRVATRATPYAYYILEQVKDRGMPTELALLPIVESAYDPFMYSNAGAAGLWQFMPGTGSGFNLRQDWWYDGRRDIYASTNAALNYLQYLYDYFNGDWLLALAAYNSGEGTVSNAVNRNVRRGLPTDFWHLKLPSQTRAYVPKLLALAIIVNHPDEYPVSLPFIPNAPYLAIVTVDSQLNLTAAAKYADISVEELYNLNPGYKKWTTDPTGPHKIIIPVDKVAQFKEALAAAPSSETVSWNRYVVKRGDSLATIAKQHNTSQTLIEKINSVNAKVLHAGQALLIPIGSQTLPDNMIASIKHYLHDDEQLPGQKRVVYVVKAGDTLGKVANRNSVSVYQLAFWNQLSTKATLTPGQELILWTKGRRSRSSYSSSEVRPYVVEYTVAPGDALADIAQKYHVTTADIRKANNLKNNNVEVGQMLIIPPAIRKLNIIDQKSGTIRYKIQSGDNLGKIALKYGVSIDKLKSWNNISGNNQIIAGKTLLIYR